MVAEREGGRGGEAEREFRFGLKKSEGRGWRGGEERKRRAWRRGKEVEDVGERRGSGEGGEEWMSMKICNSFIIFRYVPLSCMDAR